MPPPPMATAEVLVPEFVIVPALVTEPPFPTYTVSAEFPEIMLRVPPDSLSTEPEARRTPSACPVIDPAFVTVPAPPRMSTPA
jgi:hypothetical protein